MDVHIIRNIENYRILWQLSCSIWLSVAADENASIQTNERPRTIYTYIQEVRVL